MMMKTSWCPTALLCLYLLPAATKQGQKHGARLVIASNPSAIYLRDKPVIITSGKLPGVPVNFFPLLLAGNDTVPAQLDDLDGDGVWDELFFVADFKPHQQRKFSLQWLHQEPRYTQRTSIRFGKRMTATEPVKTATEEVLTAREIRKSLGFQRYQTDGPLWENDKVAFRHYLDGRNAKDLFGKRVGWMSPDSVGINSRGEVEDNYHVMADGGRDVREVGNSTGIGGIALVKGDSLLRLGVTAADSINNVEKTSFKIVKEGPVKSVLEMAYYHWKPADNIYSAKETVDIWPGMYAYHNRFIINGLKNGGQPAIGLVSIYAGQPPTIIQVNDEWTALLSHARHGYRQEWIIGLALLVPTKKYDGFIAAPKEGKLSKTLLAKLKAADGETMDYYAIGAWEGSDARFSDATYFQSHVMDLAGSCR